MKKLDVLCIISSAFLYTLPFLLSDIFWWSIFISPVPLLYLACLQDLSFAQGYAWAVIVFLLHLSKGITVIVQLAGDSWWIGIMLAMSMVLYQALVPALLFWCITRIISFFSVRLLLLRLTLWTIALFLFIVWVDWYCIWIFGIQEGYPLMHPLILLAEKPSLLLLLPIIGKTFLTILYILVPASFTLFLWYKSKRIFLFFTSTLIPWMVCFIIGFTEKQESLWRCHIKSLPCMIHSTTDNPIIAMKIVAHHIKKIITQYPDTTIVIMPESALNIFDFEKRTGLFELWNEQAIGKPIDLIFGSCRKEDNNYYNSLYWIKNGVLQTFFDKKHAVLITERLADWMDCELIKKIYVKDGVSITRSGNNRMPLHISNNNVFIPYICSELFFNEFPDDCYGYMPIIAIVNDTLLSDSYMQKLLLLLARFKAIQWQREIVYVSYGQSLFIDAQGLVKNID